MQDQLKMVSHLRLRDQPVIGVDEVGRGCLAGDVYAAAVILHRDFDHREITDSKKLSASRREELATAIKASCHFSIAFATVQEIDEINILQASLLAMKRAIVDLVAKTKLTAGLIAVDGNQLIRNLPPGLESFKQRTFIQGDFRVKPIGAASIIAKVARDQYMKELDLEFPQYGFASHKAYACESHRLAIQKHGPCRHHRKTFSGVKEFFSGRCPEQVSFEEPLQL